MKVVVAIDTNGHFVLSNLLDKHKTLNVLKTPMDGNHFINTCNDYNIAQFKEKHLDNILDDEWKDYVKFFVKQATLEIIDI